MDRREYDIKITVNGRHVTKVIVDAHYEKKHGSSIDDAIVLMLVELLDGGVFPVQDRNGPYEYFVTDGLKIEQKTYKLVWLLEDDQIYVGVVNAYRRK